MKHLLSIHTDEENGVCFIELDLPSLLDVPITIGFNGWEFRFEDRELNLEDPMNPVMEVWHVMGDDGHYAAAKDFLMKRGWSNRPVA